VVYFGQAISGLKDNIQWVLYFFIQQRSKISCGSTGKGKRVLVMTLDGTIFVSEIFEAYRH